MRSNSTVLAPVILDVLSDFQGKRVVVQLHQGEVREGVLERISTDWTIQLKTDDGFLHQLQDEAYGNIDLVPHDDETPLAIAA